MSVTFVACDATFSSFCC